jgi:catechol 2,3-dioxygenase-like lactoylglutathione lyase family enzyme
VIVRGVRWVGIATERYDEMLGLFRDVLGLRLAFEQATTVELEAAGGDAVQLFAPGDPYYAFFREHALGPVPLFEVDDVRGARRELQAAGVEIVGERERDSTWEWIHVRAPDGNLYEFASRRR